MTARYLIRRILSLSITLLVIITVIFFLFRVIPGDAADFLIDPLSEPQLRENLRAELGLDRPVWVQYGYYMRDLARGDLGSSFFYQRPVTELVGKAFLWTFTLAMVTTVFAYGLGCILGIIFAWKRNSRFERWGSFVALTIRGAPPFWLGLMLVYLFALRLGWLPEGGLSSQVDNHGASYIFSLEFLRHLALPAITSVLYAVALPTLLMRNSMLDVLNEEYLDLARAKGVKEWIVIIRHGARNALLPMIAQGGTFLGWAVGGLVSVEVVFAWPGLGRQIVHGLLSRDYPVVQGAFIAIALLVMFLYLLVDLVVAVLDPKADLE